MASLLTVMRSLWAIRKNRGRLSATLRFTLRNKLMNCSDELLKLLAVLSVILLLAVIECKFLRKRPYTTGSLCGNCSESSGV